jgi:RNA polymerase sigma factor (sigma-70 family)
VIDPSARTLTRLGRLVGDGTESVSDADLLRRYVATHDGTAFAAIVRRLGPMVFGVCRRTLGHAQDAEDAFQATFLILARKAHTVRPNSLSRWLYRVAVRVGNKARVRRARRMAVEREVEHVAEPVATPAPGPRDWLPLLDSALAKLSDRDRRTILLCDLLGRSRAEAAAELGIAEGTLSSRLARSRDKLRAKLTRLGAALSLPTLSASLADEATAIVPASLIQSTLAAETSAAAARELAEGVMRTMFFAKFTKLALFGACLAGAVAAGVIWLPGTGTNWTATAKETSKGAPPPPAKDSPKADSDLARIQGTWVVESARVPEQDDRGRARFGAAGAPNWTGKAMTFADGRVECNLFPGGAQFFRLDSAHNPKRIDFTFRNVEPGPRLRVTDTVRPSIYRFDGDRLQIVLGDEELRERPDSFEPTGKESPFVYLVLRRPSTDELKRLQEFEHSLLQGSWVGYLEIAGGDERLASPEVKLVVKGDRLRFDRPGTDSLHATFQLDISARPWRIDLTATSDGGGAKKGQSVPGIVARQGEFVLLALGTDARPANFESAEKDRTAYVLIREGRSTRILMEYWRPLTGTPSAPARETPAKADTKRLRELQQERVKALEDQMLGQFERVKIGKDPLIQLIDVVRELAEARLDVAETREQRLSAVEEMLKTMRDVETQLVDLQAAGLQTKQGVAQAKAARLKAEIQLEKLKIEK